MICRPHPSEPDPPPFDWEVLDSFTPDFGLPFIDDLQPGFELEMENPGDFQFEDIAARRKPNPIGRKEKKLNKQ
jgi:hypothetical protein